MRVIIAEKPSVAKNIADALHIKKRADGYFEGEQELITWAFGHLLELYDAKDYDEKMQVWRMENFPFIPDSFQYKIKEDRKKKKVDAGAKKQLQCIKTLIARKDVESVISACDYDREGQIIGDIILTYIKTKKPVYRMLLNEWTEEEVKKGFASLVPNTTMQPLQDAGLSRQHADWLIGINLTSVATLKYKQQKGEVFNVGRVLLPTLKMIYDRDREIEGFNPEPYYKLTATFEKEGASYQGVYTEDKKDKFTEKEKLDQVYEKIKEKQGRLTQKETVEKKEYPPFLFNLSGLQGYISSKYQGFTSDKVLQVAQALYEKKYITYPRTASSVLDESLVEKTKKVLFAHKKGLPYEDEIRFKVSPRVFNSQKVESHSAIIPTYMVPSSLGPDERKVYDAIRNRFLMQFMPVAQIEETIYQTDIEGIPLEGTFIAKGKVQKVLGWKKIEQEESKDTLLPDLEKGTLVEQKELDQTTHATTPPKPYTEKTLLRAMETCGKQFKEESEGESGEGENAMMEAVLSGFSIGTPATRAETIKKLVYTGYVTFQRKNIRCTDKGKNFIEVLPVKELMDLEYTGKLEKTLADMEKGTVSKEVFMGHIRDFVQKAIIDLKSQTGKAFAIKQASKQEISPSSSAPKSSKSEKRQENLAKTREVLGNCPLCKSPIIEGNKGFGCSGYKQGCTFVIWKQDETFEKYQKKITKTAVKSLLRKGNALIKGFKTAKGTTFDAIVTYKYDKETKKGEWHFEKPTSS
jgi:DNA topoisomerase-3